MKKDEKRIHAANRRQFAEYFSGVVARKQAPLIQSEPVRAAEYVGGYPVVHDAGEVQVQQRPTPSTRDSFAEAFEDAERGRKLDFFNRW